MVSGIIKPIPPDLVPLPGHGGGGIAPPVPFVSAIKLMDTVIAGTTHIDDIDRLAGDLVVGARLVLRREPKNEHDFAAIRVSDTDGHRVGFIPASENEVISRLMDAGKYLYAEVTEKELRGSWHRISIRVFMED